jgi:hypothetical protein
VDTAVDTAGARLAWQVGEPVHLLLYFHPRFGEITEAAGCKGFWMGYYGCRAAPLGPVPPAVVEATFYSFSPSHVAGSVPGVWTRAAPATLLETRLAAADTALRDCLGGGADGVGAPRVRRAAELAGRAAASAQAAGRPLAAANLALPVPEPPHLALWQALSTLREHRGDGHLTTLVRRELAPCEAVVLATAVGQSTPEQLRRVRGWTEQDWAGAVGSLAARGWVDPAGAATEVGGLARAEIEAETDRLAAQPYAVLGADGLAELTDILFGLSSRIVAAGRFLDPNPIGLTWPPARRRPPVEV